MNDDNQLTTALMPFEPSEEARFAGRNGRSHHLYSRSQLMNERPQRESRTARVPAQASIDPLCFVEMLMQRWRLLLLAGGVAAAVAALAGMFLWRKSCTAVAQLIRHEPIGVNEFFKGPLLTPDTFAGILKSPELLQRVATNARPPVSAELLAKAVFIKPEVDSDLVRVAVKGKDPQTVVNLANLYAEEAVRFTRELQKREVTELSKTYLQQQLGSMDEDLTTLQNQFKNLPSPSAGLVTSKLTEIHGTVSNLTQQVQASPRMTTMTGRLYERLAKEMESLGDLTKVYSDANPKVQQQQALVENLKRQYAEAATNSATGGMGNPDLAGGMGFNPTYEIIRSKLQALHNSRELLADRQREAQAFAANPPGNVRTFAPATLKGVVRDRRWVKVGVASIFGGLVGIVFAAGGLLLVEIMDDRLKTTDDVKRVTKLPVIATLDDLGRKGPSARERWAFRTWTMLQGRLSPSANQGLVCGITSSQVGEGRSTWVNLLAEAASLSGFRVLTIATRPTASGVDEPEQIDGHGFGAHQNGADSNSKTLTTNVLASPGEVTAQLSGPNPQPMVHIPLPGWVWNLERRMQWQDALNHWRKIDNVVILVELPPASTPEAVLLGQNLPNLVWLANSGTARAGETRAQLETLRHARCNLVGAVLNHESLPPLRNRFPRWLGCLVLSLALGISGASARQPNPPAGATPTPAVAPAPAVPGTNASFSVTPAQRADWQRRLTLGPGDILSFSLYGQPELTKSDVFIGPDGRVGFLEAQNILAAGLTVDELRTNIDQQLSQYRRSPRTIITPALYQSKKYYMLGKVVVRGAYSLDRPITIVEAVARARGLETGLSDRNTLDIADFQKSFLMRKGKRIPINFDRLFEQGDLSQNIPIEPEDYLYFPAANLKEVYVLGEVQFPGVVTYTPELTAIGALAARGGFNTRAYKSRVLVIRGSLNNPQHFIVDTKAIMAGGAQDLRLQPKDIVYVSSRPFIRVEELADLAATAFIQSVTAEWTGRNIGPLFRSAFIPAP
jgi:protein involved in polysaccharide export with SLBB domain/capsular polysaccharide biosynthesis protein